MVHDIQKAAFSKALTFLNASGAEYAIKFDGGVYGTLELAPERSKKSLYKRGETHKYFWPLVSDMVIGEVREVPFNSFEGRILASNISSACVRNWGVGCSIVRLCKDTDVVAVLRVG